MNDNNVIVDWEVGTVKTVVSPDMTDGKPVSIGLPNERVVLIPMPEWKQCAQRGVRSFIQASTFLLGGGGVALFLAQFGIAPDMVASMPTSGNKLIDALSISVLFGLLTFTWNFIEFWLDIDVKWPQWRA